MHILNIVIADKIIAIYLVVKLVKWTVSNYKIKVTIEQR